MEQKPVYFEPSPPIAPAPKYQKLIAGTVEVKKQISTDRAEGKRMDVSKKKMMDASSADRAANRRDERK